MAFCEKENLLIDSGYTCVDNTFFINYLPDAPDIRSAVYLLGLALTGSGSEDNSIDTIARKLSVTAEDIMSAYQYWEELGLVRIVGETPPRVIYLNVRDTASSLKKIKPGKYSKFSRDIQSEISGRMISVNEYNSYYTFLENTLFEPEALVAVAKYCVQLKGADINYPYILQVANNQIKAGHTTLATVQEHLNCQQKYDEDLKLVFKALDLNRKFEHADRELYEKWTKDFGFKQNVIENVAKIIKSNNMSKLDAKLTEYYKHGAMSVKEMTDYDSRKDRLYELAKDINKAIGVYYQSLDMIIDEYVIGWLQKGYDDETLLAIAKYCFRSGIRTLNGAASIIDKLYKNGVTNLNALEQYLDNLARKDDQIKRVLACAGLDRNVTANDRALYKTWTEIWGMPLDVIIHIAELAAGTTAPLAYINRVLADCKQTGDTTLEKVKNRKAVPATASATATKVLVGGRDMERRTYTDEQLAALFTALDETED